MNLDFIVSGFAKNGTTYLDALLRSHPDVCMPPRTTEYSFFDDDRIYKNGINWYFSLFKDCNKIFSKVIGQTSADCLFNPSSIDRINNLFPNVKHIAIVRDPIQSLNSLYWHQIKMGREYRSLDDALRREPDIVDKNYYNFKMYSYLNRSRIFSMVANLKQKVNNENILVIPFEFFVKNELTTLNIVCDFIGISKINSLSELDSGDLIKNPAQIPSSFLAVRIAYIIRKMKMPNLAQLIINPFLIESKPPRISDELRIYLEEELKVDIEFHKELSKLFEKFI